MSLLNYLNSNLQIFGANYLNLILISKSTIRNITSGVHQGLVLSPLLFVIVLEALSREFRAGLPMNLLYADDLVLIAETL